MSLDSIAWLEGPVPRARAAEMTATIIGELSALPPKQRAEAVDKAKLPISALNLGEEAVPLLRMLVEDDVLRPFFGDGAVRIWLSLDNVDGLASLLAHASEVSSLTLMQALERIDEDEVYDVVEERMLHDDGLRLVLPSKPNLVRDVRFLDLALKLLHTDPDGACRLLAAHGTDRAMEELVQIAVNATSVDAVLIGALHGLVHVKSDERVGSVVFTLMARPFAEALSRQPPFCALMREHSEAISAEIGPSFDLRRIFNLTLYGRERWP